MSLFANFDSLDPYAMFAAAIKRSRLAMREAFRVAFKAYVGAVALVDRHMYETMRHDDGTFELMGLEYVKATPRMSPGALERLHARAVALDRQADYQAAPVLLFADDALQRFAKGVLGKAPGLTEPGYGPEYGTHMGNVTLTRLLRAGTNAIRHVSEWDDSDIPFPYPSLADLPKKCAWRQPMESIEILQQVFGIGRSERIRDPASMRILIRIDGVLGTGKPAYSRYEQAVLKAAQEIASADGRASVRRLQGALKG